jgi:hypothetical protein
MSTTGSGTSDKGFDSANPPKDPHWEIPINLKQKGLNFVHLNVRSLIPKLTLVKRLLNETKTAVLALSETLLDETVPDGEISVDGYSLLRQDRNRHGGGVLFYIRDGLAFNHRPELSVVGLETVWMELLLPKTKSILLNCFYRPPGDSSFLGRFETCLGKVDPSSEWYILGDMNIDFAKKGSPLCKRCIDLLNLFDCEQMVAEATRITSNTNSTLDHIVTNSRGKISKCGTLAYGFSDHLAVYCTRSSPKTGIFKPLIKHVRSFKNYSKEALCDRLRLTDWSSVLLSSNVDAALDRFLLIFKGIMNEIAPFRDIRVKQRTEPWINTDILAGIRKRDDEAVLFS